MTNALVASLARAQVRPLPAYNAGLSNEAVRARYGVTDIARLASNENPFGASASVRRAIAEVADDVGNYPDANCTALREAIARAAVSAPDQAAAGWYSQSPDGDLPPPEGGS